MANVGKRGIPEHQTPLFLNNIINIHENPPTSSWQKKYVFISEANDWGVLYNTVLHFSNAQAGVITGDLAWALLQHAKERGLWCHNVTSTL